MARPAFTELVNLLRQQDDVAGLRTLHQKGEETGNPDTLYALDVLGQVLNGHGDTEGAHAAWQQAIDAGYEFADDLRERISPCPEPEDEPDDEAGLADVPPEFDPRNLVRIGIDVLEHGLPALPETLTYRMARRGRPHRRAARRLAVAAPPRPAGPGRRLRNDHDCAGRPARTRAIIPNP